jgi:hypothetical protein
MILVLAAVERNIKGAVWNLTKNLRTALVIRAEPC